MKGHEQAVHSSEGQENKRGQCRCWKHSSQVCLRRSAHLGVVGGAYGEPSFDSESARQELAENLFVWHQRSRLTGAALKQLS
mmetsp:Transcript_108517/g.350142  ORF Transcript_108517/g.350142 Transcript_108517/m.350142 type:complete len:82 (-) Transcript_108517:21-266(-)